MLRATLGAILCAAAYAAGYAATAITYVLTNGIEGDPDDFLPFYAVFCLLVGGLLRRRWLLPLPALHMYLVDPWDATPGIYGPSLYVLVGTVGIAIGVVARLVTRHRTTQSASVSPAPNR